MLFLTSCLSFSLSSCKRRNGRARAHAIRTCRYSNMFEKQNSLYRLKKGAECETSACRQSRARREDAAPVARRAPRDRAQAAWLAVQCPAVQGGPRATAAHRQGDPSPRHADGLGALCGASPAQGGRARPAWTASLTRARGAGVPCGRADGVRALGARSCRRRRRTGKPSTGGQNPPGAGPQASRAGGGTGRRDAEGLSLRRPRNWRAG